MQYFSKTNIDFLGSRKFFAIFSISLSVLGLIAIFVLGVNLGIDFKGGAEMAVQFKNTIETNKLRENIATTGMKNVEIKSFGGDNQYLIRVDDVENGANKVQEALTKAYTESAFTILKVDKIGPKIGKELFTQALWSVFLAIVFMLIYIAFRFEFIFGVGAIVALVHDVLVSFAIVVVLDHLGAIHGLEFSQSLLAALLTVIGYSINDTVIIFDRIRENRDRHKGMNFYKLVNMSINETLSRTINTVATVVGVLLILVFVGGPVLQGFAFTMFLGIVFGTYSSVYIASSTVLWYMKYVKKMDLTGTETPKKSIAGARM